MKEWRLKRLGDCFHNGGVYEVYVKDSCGIKSYFTLEEIVAFLEEHEEYRVPNAYDFDAMMEDNVSLPKGEYLVGNMILWMTGSRKVEDCCVYIIDGKKGVIEQRQNIGIKAQLLVVEE